MDKMVDWKAMKNMEKRPVLGKIVTELSDYVIFTNDNPRDEKATDIINDIISELTTDNFKVVYNRKESIKYAIKNFSEDYLVVILGKGNEKYQIVNNIYYEYNDKETIKEILEG